MTCVKQQTMVFGTSRYWRHR